MARQGDVLGGTYLIRGTLGAGGTANVYLAEQIESGERYALKEIPVEKAERAGMLAELLLKEKLYHPALPHLWTAWEERGNVYLMMDYVEGIGLDALLRERGAIGETQAVEWAKQVKTKGANKEKPARPDVAIWFPPNDTTRPAFLQNAMALEAQGGRTQYLNMPEVEMADGMCGGHKQVSQMLRNIYDRQRAGALRATADGVTGSRRGSFYYVAPSALRM